MTQFKYRAQDPDGTPVEGAMEDSSARRVTARLEERGLTVTAVDPIDPVHSLLRQRQALTWSELQAVSDHLLTVAKSKLPMAPALKHMAHDLHGPRLKGALERVHTELERGSPLSEAIAKHPQHFPHLYQTLIRAGEASGNLAGVLQLLSSYATRQIQIKNTLEMALFYPAIVFAFVIGLLILILFYIVPSFELIFMDFDARLPGLTRFWIEASHIVRYKAESVALVLAILIIIAFVIRSRLRRSESGRAVIEHMRMALPIIGRQYYLSAVVRFCHTLAILLKAGVPVIESLELAATASGSTALSRAVSDASLQVASGQRISDALAATDFFGHNLCWLVSTAEDRGEVDLALESAASAYDRELAVRDRFTGLAIGPIAIILIAMLILSIVFSLYLPIFSLADTLSG
jgi:type IV pilus assembly protein PilC